MPYIIRLFGCALLLYPFLYASAPLLFASRVTHGAFYHSDDLHGNKKRFRSSGRITRRAVAVSFRAIATNERYTFFLECLFPFLSLSLFIRCIVYRRVISWRHGRKTEMSLPGLSNRPYKITRLRSRSVRALIWPPREGGKEPLCDTCFRYGGTLK